MAAFLHGLLLLLLQVKKVYFLWIQAHGKMKRHCVRLAMPRHRLQRRDQWCRLHTTPSCRCVGVTCKVLLLQHVETCAMLHLFHTQPNSVRGLSDMQALVNTWSTTPVNARAAGLIVDARPAGRFTGTVPEPRAGMRSGHMPGAVNVPLTDMLTDDGCMKPADVLRAVFAAAHVGPGEGPLVFSCGTAVTACGVRLGYALAYPEGGDSQVRGGGGCAWMVVGVHGWWAVCMDGGWCAWMVVGVCMDEKKERLCVSTLNVCEYLECNVHLHRSAYTMGLGVNGGAGKIPLW